ncbi:MAG: hypothetical protein ABSH28_18560 [Acidobacteriota bacterium]|jgi:hypothetical protein
MDIPQGNDQVLGPGHQSCVPGLEIAASGEQTKDWPMKLGISNLPIAS